MAKCGYIGVAGVAHKLRKHYVGVNNVARRVKKIYIGVGGVARPCFTGQQIIYYGQITPGLYGDCDRHGGASVGEYVIFAGGLDSRDALGRMSSIATACAYDASLTKVSVTSLSSASTGPAGVSNGEYALFGGGDAYSSSYVDRSDHSKGTLQNYSYSKVVTAYNQSLTRSTPTQLGLAVAGIATGTVGDYMLFAGGCSGSVSPEPKRTVFHYDRALTSGLIAVEQGFYNAAVASVGDYALIAGKRGSDSVGMIPTVDVIDVSLTLSTAPQLCVTRPVCGASTAHHAVFAGGDYVDAYDAALTRRNADPLTASKSGCKGVSIGEFALFVGGSGSNNGDEVADAYDGSLSHVNPTTTLTSLSVTAGACAGNNAIFTSNANVYLFTLQE